jgi:hypothetical protein
MASTGSVVTNVDNVSAYTASSPQHGALIIMMLSLWAAIMAFPIRCRLFCSEAVMNRQMIKRRSVLNKRDDLQ